MFVSESFYPVSQIVADFLLLFFMVIKFLKSSMLSSNLKLSKLRQFTWVESVIYSFGSLKICCVYISVLNVLIIRWIAINGVIVLDCAILFFKLHISNNKIGLNFFKTCLVFFNIHEHIDWLSYLGDVLMADNVLRLHWNLLRHLINIIMN